MAHDVFISYSNKDKPIADGITANLEAAGLRCWIAPRDIGPGEDWPTAITKGIAASRVMVLVFSHNANMSDEVSRELYLAANSKLIIIPFMIEKVKPEAGKAYYMGRTHWLDAMNPPTQEQIGQLIERVNSLLKPISTERQAAPTLIPEMAHDFREQLQSKRGWVKPASALIVLAALVISGTIFLPKLRGAAQPTSTQVVPPASSQLTALPPTLRFITQQQNIPYPSSTPSVVPPTLPSIPQNQNTTFPAGTPAIYLYREDFNDVQFDGALPPKVKIDPSKCLNLKIMQAKGALTFDAPSNSDLSCFLWMDVGFPMILSDIKAVEFALSTSPETPINHPQFSFLLAGSADNDQKKLDCMCGWEVNRANCYVNKEKQNIYHTKDLSARPGDTFTFRIEVIDPDKMVYRFLANGEMIGEFTMPAADIPAYKDLFYNVGGGPQGRSSPTKGGVYLMDYIAIEQR